jgi:hypothetical protein
MFDASGQNVFFWVKVIQASWAGEHERDMIVNKSLIRTVTFKEQTFDKGVPVTPAQVVLAVGIEEYVVRDQESITVLFDLAQRKQGVSRDCYRNADQNASVPPS